uniref:Putative permease n=1 Tax=uncultured marine group II/III euryarchaeote KM3_83_G03 TaxID=1456522 RepID=A0A075HS67_9EURY|nr:putative permease [uncultured marine group II/III euryarchaeote KM3_83_G03]
MNKSTNHKHLYFTLLLLFLAYVSFLIIKPFFTFIFIGLVLAYFSFPMYEKILKKVKGKVRASMLSLLVVLVLIIIPSLLITNNLFHQTASAVISFGDYSGKLNTLLGSIGFEQEGSEFLTEIVGKSKNFILSNSSAIIGSVSDIILGLLVMFFVMYYCFKDGKELLKWLQKYVPFAKKHKKELVTETKSIIDGVIYGQFVTAIVQGVLGGIMLFVFGIENYIFWAFIMMILSFLPLIGAAIIWLPIGLLELLNANYVSGLGILITGFFVISTIDNFIRPKLVGGKADVHPIVVLIGVLGGLAVFGFVGFIVGPLAMALFVNLTKFYAEDRNR